MRLVLPQKLSLRRGIQEDCEVCLVYVPYGDLAPRALKGGGGGGRGGASVGSRGGSSGRNGGRAGVSFGVGKRGASLHSKGGGPPAKILSGPFVGRTAGGGTRGQIYGTTRYGSGYPNGGGSYVSGRNFTFGYWPIYLPIEGGTGYYGYHEYGPATNSSRPGGAMHRAQVRLSSWPSLDVSSDSTVQTNNATASYYIVGDADSVVAVMNELVTTCSVSRASSVALNETKSTVHVEQAVQYYRASSFMLALTSYNNSANLPSNAPLDNSAPSLPLSVDMPLPAGTDLNFLKCLNNTIATTVPIMNAPKSMKNVIIVVTLTTVAAVFVLGMGICRCICRRRHGYGRI